MAIRGARAGKPTNEDLDFTPEDPWDQMSGTMRNIDGEAIEPSAEVEDDEDD